MSQSTTGHQRAQSRGDMLYEQWRQIARERSAEIALTEVASLRRWTFHELAEEADTGSPENEMVVFPSGGSGEFILRVLRAWRSGRVVCPLEPGQAPAVISSNIPGEIVHLKSTSATTGSSRLVAFTASQLQADSENIVATMGLRPDWPNIGVISLAHSYGFSNLVLPLLLQGVPLILGDGALPESLRQAAALAPDVTVAAVPALWQTWQNAQAIPSNIRLAISAGAPLTLALEQTVFARYGLKIHNFYGSSECGGIAYDASAVPRSDQACAGVPLANVEVSVGTNGCLVVRSSAVAQSDWPEAGRGLSPGIFHTSDLGEISGGVVYLRGRASDQINVAGRKVSPETIEQVLMAHPQVRACVAFGVPGADAQRGDVIVACVAGDKLLSSEVLKQFALSRLPGWQVPREWWLVEELAPSGRGKLSRAEWRARFLERARA